MRAIKKGKAPKHLRKGKKMEEQKPLTITTHVDASSPTLSKLCTPGSKF
jgi:type VI protein secretion system component Hcp